MSDFPCTQCGLCCRLVATALANKDQWGDPLIRAALDAFPYETDENGACKMLVDNKCSVYENRPIVCNIDKMAALRGIDKKQWFRLSAASCNYLIRESGFDESYLIKDYDLE